MTEQKEVFFPRSRFWKKQDAWSEFFSDILSNVRASREKTETEIRIQKLQENMDKMIVPYSRSSEDGLDPRSIAQERIDFLQQKVQKELKEKDVAQLQRELEAINKLLRNRQARLRELNADKSMGSQRQLEIDTARAASEKKLAAK